jgi:hypothetical protein
MVDQLLGGLFGSQDQDDEPTRRRRAHDFVDRYERGGHGQMSDAEVLQNYHAATSQLSPSQYQQAAADALRQMTPEQRRELKRALRHHSHDRINPAGDSADDLAQAMQQAQQENQGAGGLAGLFGLGGNEPANRGSQQGGGIQDVLNNPVAKMAMAGVAAMAAKHFLSDQNR